MTMAIPEEERPVIEAKTRELGGKIVHVPLAGTEVAVVALTLGRHHMPHPTCDIAEQLRRLGAIMLSWPRSRERTKDLPDQRR